MTPEQQKLIRNIVEENLAFGRRLHLQNQALMALLPELPYAARRAPAEDFIILPDGEKLFYGKTAKKRGRNKRGMTVMTGGKCQSK
jgi:hypothetical protein